MDIAFLTCFYLPSVGTEYNSALAIVDIRAIGVGTRYKLAPEAEQSRLYFAVTTYLYFAELGVNIENSCTE